MFYHLLKSTKHIFLEMSGKILLNDLQYIYII